MKHVLPFLFILFTTLSFAQLSVGNIGLEFGEDISEVDGNIISIAGVKDDIIYTLSKKSNTFYLQTFDFSSKKNLKSKVLDLDKINGNKVYIEDVVVIENLVYVMVSYYNKDKKENVFSAIEVSENLDLGTAKTVLAVPVESRKKQGIFLFEPSYDEINYMVTHININDRKELLSYEFVMLDAAMNEIVTDNHSVNFENRKNLAFDFADFGVNERGDIFIVYTESYRDKQKKTTINTVSLHTWYNNNNYTSEQIEINLEGKRVVNCDLIYTENQIQLVGFYSDLRKSGRSEFGIEGVFDIAINTDNNSITKKTFNDFTVETKSKLIGERKAQKGKNLSPFYKNTHLIERDNGGVIVLSEYYLRIEGGSSGVSIGGVGLGVTTFIYDTNEIIVTALNADGTLDWSNVVPKEQRVKVSVLFAGLGAAVGNNNFSVSAALMFPITSFGDGPEYVSSMPFYDNNVLTILVNDDPKNIGITDMDDVKRVKSINKMIPVAFEFDDATGTMKRVDPKDFEKKQIVFRPGVRYQYSDTEAIIYGSSKNETRLGTLKLR